MYVPIHSLKSAIRTGERIEVWGDGSQRRDLLYVDDATRAFLTAAGWAPDGAHRTLDLTGDGSVTLKQVRLHTDLG